MAWRVHLSSASQSLADEILATAGSPCAHIERSILPTIAGVYFEFHDLETRRSLDLRLGHDGIIREFNAFAPGQRWRGTFGRTTLPRLFSWLSDPSEVFPSRVVSSSVGLISHNDTPRNVG